MPAVDGLLLNTVVLGAEGAVALLNPKAIFPGLSPYGVAQSRHWGTSLATFALISYYAREEQKDHPSRVVISRAGVMYHVLSAVYVTYQYFSNLPFAFYHKDNGSSANAAIAAIGVTTHLVVAGLLADEAFDTRKGKK